MKNKTLQSLVATGILLNLCCILYVWVSYVEGFLHWQSRGGRRVDFSLWWGRFLGKLLWTNLSVVARHTVESGALGLPERQPGTGGLGGGLGRRELLCHPVPTCATGYKDQPPPDELSTGSFNARGTHTHTHSPHAHMLSAGTLHSLPSINLPLSISLSFVLAICVFLYSLERMLMA